MENNTGTHQNSSLNERLNQLRAQYADACRRTVRATNAWIIARCICAAVTLILLAMGIFTPAVGGSTVLGVAVTLGISYMLRRGIRVLAWLGALGGAASLILLLLDIGSYLSMAAQHPLLYLYIVVTVAAAAVQCAANGRLLADGEYRAFSQAVNEASFH